MSFKNEYDELQRQIAPDEEFLERLAEKLEDEKQVKKKRNKAHFRAAILSASAVCAAAAAAFVIIVNQPHSPGRDPDILGVGADKINHLDGLFSPSEIEAGAVSPAELADVLCDESSTVYGSEKNTFDFEDRLSAEQCRELARRIENARAVSSEPGGSAEYYMAVSESGNVVKFSISGNILVIGDMRYEI